MAGAFLILLREGFEAALIVGIVLALLARMGELRYGRHVAAGVGAAVVASILFAWLADGVSALFSGAGQEVFNGIILAVACAMITYVMVWLRGSQREFQAELARQVHERVMARGLGVFVLVFVSVFREGVEAVLFLWGILAGGRDDTLALLTGGVLGIGAAVLIAWALFQGGRRLPLRLFFNATTILLVFLAAGMLAHGAGLWVAVNWLPALAYGVWNTASILPDHSGLGAVLAVLIGYNANPTLMEVLVYGGYLAAVGLYIWWDGRRTVAAPDAASPS